jgi:hypothetical protein
VRWNGNDRPCDDRERRAALDPEIAFGGVLLRAMGFGLAFPPLMALGMSAASQRDSGLASGCS